MSTLGDLLAEHTVLPGGAVDHLHAVVGEWQLLADMSFGDFLMWVRRDDGTLVCVAQCRPNTASTLLITDAVGTVVAEEGLLGAGAGALPRRGGGAADPPDRARRPAHLVAAGEGLPGLRRATAAHGVRGHLPQRRRSGDVAVQPAGR